jgi:PAS domain S-box-containing protein
MGGDGAAKRVLDAGGELLSLPAAATRQTARLWVMSGALLALSAYKLATDRSRQLEDFFAPYGSLPYVEFLSNGLFILVLALMWTAYRQWRATALREVELRRIVASINPDVLLVVAPDRTIASCNPAVADMFGYGPGEVVGRKTDLLYGDRRPAGDGRPVHHSLECVGFHVGLASGRRKDGGEFPIEIITGLLRGASGAVVLIRDITERKRIEDQYLRAKEEAENAQKTTAEALAKLEASYEELKNLQTLREKLTHMIVHDLKSPLATIGGYLDLVRQFAAPRLGVEEKQSLGEASKLVRRMREMILSLLDLSRLEENAMPLRTSRTDLVALSREALDILGQDGPFSQVLVEAVPPSVTVVCDPDITRRVIVNLVDNALKYTPPSGMVRVRVESRPAGAYIAVIDEGAGIPPEYHRKIFERFAQVEARKYSTGLGLTFCDLAVRAHGGTIGVESEVGRGTKLWFVLPEACGAGAAAAAPKAGAMPTPAPETAAAAR